MMEKLRIGANSLPVKIIFGLIILGFIFTGVGGFLGFGSGSNDERMYIAKVDGEGIDRQTFEREARAATQNIVALGNTDNSLVQTVRRSVLADIIGDNLFYRLADELNIKISNNYLKNIIRNQTIFWDANSFSNQKYLSLLNESGYTPDTYADALKLSAEKEQLYNALFRSDFLLEDSQNIVRLMNQMRTVYVTDYSLSNMNNDDFTITDEEIDNYFNNNLQEFYHEPRLKMKFLANFLPAIEKETIVTSKEIESYYNNNGEAAFFPEKRLYSVLTFENTTLAEKARHSLIKKDGRKLLHMESLGWFPIDSSFPDFLKIANLKKIGEISQPIENNGIYYLFRLDKIEQRKKKTLVLAKESIFSLLYNEKVQRKYKEQLDALEQVSKLSTSIDEMALKSGVPLFESGWNYEKESFGISRFPEINAVAFSNEMIRDGKPTGKISDIIYVEQYDSSYIIQVVDYQEAGISPFDDVKEEIRYKLLSENKKAAFEEHVNSIVARFNNQEVVPDIRFANKITLSRNTKIDDLDEKTVQDIFSVVPSSGRNRVYGASFIDGDSAKLFVLLDVNNSVSGEFSLNNLSQIVDGITKNSFYKYLRSKSKIEIMPDANL